MIPLRLSITIVGSYCLAWTIDEGLFLVWVKKKFSRCNQFYIYCGCRVHSVSCHCSSSINTMSLGATWLLMKWRWSSEHVINSTLGVGFIQSHVIAAAVTILCHLVLGATWLLSDGSMIADTRAVETFKLSLLWLIPSNWVSTNVHCTNRTTSILVNIDKYWMFSVWV